MKVLSCKVDNPTMSQFQEVAEGQGETRASLLKNLVVDFLGNGDKVDAKVAKVSSRLTASARQGLPPVKTRSGDRLPLRKSPSSDTSSGNASPGEGLHSEYLPHDHRPDAPKSTLSTPAGYNGLPDNVSVDDRSSALSPTSKPLSPRNDAKGKPETSPKSSVGILLLLGLFLFQRARSKSKTAVDHSSLLLAQEPSEVDHGSPSHNGDKSTFYNEYERLAVCCY